MKTFLAVGLVVCINLALVLAVVAFGAVTVEYAAPAYVAAMLAGLFWIAKLLSLPSVSWKHSPLHLPVAAFLVYAAVRYFTSPLEYDSRVELFHISLYGFCYFLVVSNCHHSRDRTLLVATLAVLAFLEAGYGFWQYAYKAETVLYLLRPEQYQNRAGGTFICPNHLAGFLEMVFGLLLARITVMRTSRKAFQKATLRKVFLAYAALVILAGLIATFSRAGWLSTLVGLCAFIGINVATRRGAQTVWPRVLVGVGVILLICAVVLGMPAVREYLQASTQNPTGDPDLSLNPASGSRLAMWQATLRMIGDFPFFGTGPATWRWFHLQYREPTMQMWPQFTHNDLLNLASDYGLVGFALVLAMIGCFFWHARYLVGADLPSEQRSFAIGGVTAVVMILVHSLFDFNMHIPANALVLVTLVGATLAMDDDSKRFGRVEMRRWVRVGLATLVLAVIGAWGWFGGHLFMAHRFNSLGNDAKETVDYNAAVGFYKQALHYDPTFPEPYARLGDIYYTYGTLPARAEKESERRQMLNYAVDMYHETLLLNPYQSDVFVRLSSAYEILGEMENALIAFQESLAIDTNNAAIYAKLGAFYRRAGDETNAVNAFKKSRELNFWSDRQSEINLRELQAWP